MFRKEQLAFGFITAAVLLTFACSPSSERTRTTAGGHTSTAPSAEEVAKQDKALVRFAHSDPSTPAADLYFGDTKLFSGVDYKTVTPYMEVPGGFRELRLVQAGHQGAPPIATNNESLSDGKHYTVVAVCKEDGSKGLLTVTDDSSQPSTGKAQLRVVHAAPNVGDVDVYAAGQKNSIFTGVNFNSSTSFKELNPSTTTLEVRKENGGAEKWRLPNVNLQPGRNYTIIVAGGRDKRSVDFIRIEDQALRTEARL